jgi:predicted amidohydrolase
MKITILQLALDGRDSILRQIGSGLKQHPDTDLFVLPEFSCRDEEVAVDTVDYLRDFPEELEKAKALEALLPLYSQVKSLFETSGCAVLTGFFTRRRGTLRSSAIFFDPRANVHEKCTYYYDKTHVHWTEGFLRPGDSIDSFATRFGQLGTLICYDMAFSEPARLLALGGTELLCAVSAVPSHFDWNITHRRMIGAAVFNQYYIAAANSTILGGEPMGGHSAFYDPRGKVIAHLDHREPGVLSAEINLRDGLDWRREEAIFPFRRPGLYAMLATEEKNNDGR